MNIIQILSEKAGGRKRRYAVRLSDALSREGHSVETFAPRWGIFASVALASRINKIDGEVLIHAHSFKDAAMALNGRRLSTKPDDVKVNLYVHDCNPAELKPSVIKVYDGLDSIVFGSKFSREVFLSSNPPIRNAAIKVAPFPLDYCTSHKSSQSPANIIFSGDIHPDSGLRTLIDALNGLTDSDWRLWVWGTGKGGDVMPLVRYVRSLPIADRVEWLGDVPVGEFMEKAHIAVAPDLKPPANCIDMLDAIAAGCAVIASDSGAYREFFTDGENALLVPPGSTEDLRSALKKLLDSSDLRVRIANNGLN